MLVLLLSAILSGVALGQVGADAGNTSSGNASNETVGDMPMVGTNDGAGGMTGVSSGGGGGIFDVDVGERVLEITDTLITAGIETVRNIISTLVAELNYLLYTLPTPGEATDPMSWYLPDNGWWPEFMTFYGIMSSAAFAILVPSLMLAMIKNDSRETRQRARFAIKAIGMILAGPLLIGAFLHTFNGVNVALAPSGEEFMSTPGDAAQLGVGATLFLLLLKFYAIVVFLGLVFQLAQFVLTHIAVAMWPVSWGFRAFPSPTFEAVGEFGVNTLPLLVLLNFGQVSILRLLFMIDWGAYGWGSVIAGMVGTAVVLALVLVGAPYMLFKQQWQAVGVSIGTKQAKQAGSDAVDFASAKIENVRDRFNDSPRGSGGDSSGSGSSQPRSTSDRSGGASSGSGPQAASVSATPSSQDINRRRRDL